MTNKFFAAPPREGKTYVVVAEAVAALLNGKDVYANFPIIFEKGGKLYQARTWKKEYIYKNITDALIIIDEAQHDYDSVVVKTLDPDEDAFFATTGQNNLEVRIISQGVTRVTKAIRDRINEWIRVRKVLEFPLLRNREGKLGLPLVFMTEHYEVMEDMGSKDATKLLYKTWHFFSPLVASAYNTHYFRNQGEKFDPPYWIPELRERNIHYERLKEKPDKGRPAGISAIADGSVVSPGQQDQVSHADPSARPGPGPIPGRAEGPQTPGVPAPRVQPGILPGPYPGRQRQRPPPGTHRGPGPGRTYPQTLGKPDGSNTTGHPAGKEIPGVLPGDDQAKQNQPVQHQQGLAMAWSAPGLEEIDQALHALGPGKPVLAIQQTNSHPEMARTDKGKKVWINRKGWTKISGIT